MKPIKKSDFELAPAGTFAARITTIADLGIQRTDWQGSQREAHKLGVTFELASKRGKNGQRLAVFDRVTLSLHEQARLFQIAQAALGAEPGEELDPADLLGKAVLVTLVHRAAGTRTYANVAGVAAVPEEMTVPDTDTALLLFDLDAPDPATFARLPALFKKLIEERVRPFEEPEDAPGADPEDDVPF